MTLTSGILIQINATAIVGLLILFTFQLTPSTTLLPEKIEIIYKDIDKLKLEKVAIETVLLDSCGILPISETFDLTEKFTETPEINDLCNELLLKQLIMNEQIKSSQKTIELYKKVVEHFDSEPKNLHLVIAKFLEPYLILPFIFSIITEFIRQIKTSSNSASLLGQYSSMIGFVLLGFVIVMLTYFYAVENLYSISESSL